MKGHLRIKKAAKLTAEVLEGKRNLTKGEILKLADYSDVTSKEPDRVMDGIQFKEELALYGFTAENVKKVLGSIMTSPLVYEMVTPDNMIYKALCRTIERHVKLNVILYRYIE